MKERKRGERVRSDLVTENQAEVNTKVMTEFFFFKQKTAYEMCGRDWSSDVCSSDLYPKPMTPDLGPVCFPNQMWISVPVHHARLTGRVSVGTSTIALSAIAQTATKLIQSIPLVSI